MIDCIIRKHNYSLWRYCTNKFDIIKNEHGTYGEYNDFIIRIELCDNHIHVVKFDIVVDDKEYEKHIKTIIDQIIISGNTQFDKFCFAIIDSNF